MVTAVESVFGATSGVTDRMVGLSRLEASIGLCTVVSPALTMIEVVLTERYVSIGLVVTV